MSSTELKPEDISLLRERIRQKLLPARFEHTLGVAYTAACMGMVWKEDPLRCELAGLLHDCAKNLTDGQLVTGCREAGLRLTEEELSSPQIIHAVYGAYLAETEYGIEDREILNAVRFHTTGRAAMSTLEKIIFIADFIEPLRKKAACLTEARILAFRDIDRCMALILADTLEYLEKAGKPVEEHTLNAYQYYKGVL